MLSKPIKIMGYSMQPPDQRCNRSINKAGTDIAPKNIRKIGGKIILDKENINAGKHSMQTRRR